MRNKMPALAAFGNTFWTAALQLLAVRVYLELLGMEAYGVIGFFLSLQGLLQVLDAGLAPAVNRELARSQALGRLDAARTLLRTLGVIYWCVGATIALGLVLLSSGIANMWLNARALNVEELTKAIMLMALIVAVRWPVAVYYNALIGLGQLGRASLFSAALSTVSIGCSIAALTFISADLTTLFTVQAIVALAGVLVIQRLAWHAIGERSSARFSWRALSEIWRFSLGMGGVTLTAVVLTQLDKVLLSRLLPLHAFGEYMIAATLTAGLLLLVSPLMGIIFPRFSALVAGDHYKELKALYREGSQLFGFLFIPIVLAIALFGTEIVWVWTGHHDTALRVAPIMALLAVGYGINGMMFFPYALQLALGFSRIPLAINLAMMSIMVPLIFTLTTAYGAIGGAAAWPILQIAYLIVGTAVTHHYSDQGSALRWILRSIVAPLAIGLAVLLGFRMFLTTLAIGPVMMLIGAGAGVFVVWAIAALLHPSARSAIIRLLCPPRGAFIS